tara:strand:- start:665 stop:1081 length:417 start_codon:yes stop_codon:yes gene_type:complete
MLIESHRQDIQTKNGLKNVINFTGHNKEGFPCGASLWIGGPQDKPDGTRSKGNLWQYRRLATALGPDALKQYEEKDEQGYSKFDPHMWRNIEVLVTVGAYGIDTIEKAPPQDDIPEVGDPQNLDDGRHDDGSNDDIPF